ncbi:MAG: DUF285 domain-containing protein [Bacteroidales bacterium]|nr:DUF285 domain-containing protein [Bacteroidales bacterium]
MKKKFKPLFVAMLFTFTFSAMFCSCNKDDDDNNPKDNPKDETQLKKPGTLINCKWDVDTKDNFFGDIIEQLIEDKKSINYIKIDVNSKEESSFIVGGENSDCETIYAVLTGDTLKLSTRADSIYTNKYAGRMFNSFTNAKFINLEKLNVSKTEDFSYMFSSCNAIEKLDLSSWKMDKAINLSHMFYSCESLKEINLSNWKLIYCEDMSYTFAYCKSLENLIFDKSGISSENLESTFYGCSSLKSIDLSNWYCPFCTKANDMFYKCTNLESVNLETIDLQSCEDMSGMFCNCENIKSIDMSKLNTIKSLSFAGMFANCKKLEKVEFPSNVFGLNKCENFSRMFFNCYELKDIDLSKLSVIKGTDFSEMFYQCKSLEKADLKKWQLSGSDVLYDMFCYCENLKELRMPISNLSDKARLDGFLYKVTAKVICNKDTKAKLLAQNNKFAGSWEITD